MFTRPRRSARLGAVALSLALFASACGGSTVDEAAPATDTGTVDGASGAVEDAGGAAIPQLIGDTVAGSQIDTNDLAGQDVAIWFWAPW